MGSVLGSLGELGYGFAYRVLDAAYCGVPQQRRRVFIVGHLGAPFGAAAEVLFEPESGGGDSAAGGTSRPGVADTAAGSVGTLGNGGGIAPALVARYGKGTDSDATDAPDRQRTTHRITSTLQAHAGKGIDAESAAGGHLVVGKWSAP